MAYLDTIAKDVSTGAELVSGIFPFIGSLLGPAGAVVDPAVELVLKAVDDGAKTIAAGKPDATPTEIFQELISHLTAGQPNSPALS